MSLKDLLLVLDAGPANDDRLALAIGLAKRFDAHLVGLHPSSTAEGSLSSIGFDSALFDAAMRETLARLEARSAKVRAAFEAATQREAVSAEWRVARGYPGPETVLNARYADLVILGQRRPDDSPLDTPDPADVVLDAGCPALIVPYAGRFERIERHALIAWNASSQAARAVRDALPLLKACRAVTVLAVNPKQGVDAHGQEPGADIARHLARHGIPVETDRSFTAATDPADEILSRAADYGSDLIVMGGYGHSRVREMVLGGVTRSILQQMTVPVLMSH
ncbi:hypothetical protein GCM10011611_57610 [Aliidongia dinghuensis]|uniref:UspA domain-containing protein n=1 Tax=Aliidongia dinghuensis TaxID=1867774 RepID=A0A8J3E7K7_9PROT|nr:universal stress protein [Aliidongia dinghuensis]GGF43709.1 hypothetical protein GCM10011611_57610 [Aliidongia dinghuensis]